MPFWDPVGRLSVAPGPVEGMTGERACKYFSRFLFLGEAIAGFTFGKQIQLDE